MGSIFQVLLPGDKSHLKENFPMLRGVLVMGGIVGDTMGDWVLYNLNPQKYLMDMRCRYFCQRSKVKGQRSKVKGQMLENPQKRLMDLHMRSRYRSVKYFLP